jgi:hypothetical protein
MSSAAKEDHSGKGAKLFVLFEETIAERGDNRGEVLEAIGFTEAYYMVYRRGERWIGTVTQTKLEAFAKYLKIPLANVYLLAEILKPADFVERESLPKRLSQLYDVMLSDDTMRPYVPSADAWARTPTDTKLLVYFMFKEVTGKEIDNLANELAIRKRGHEPDKSGKK